MFKVIAIPDDPYIGNLRDETSRRKLEEGENVIHETSAGQKLLLDVVDGKRAGYKAIDQYGNQYPIVYFHDPSTEHVRVCACFPTGNECWWVNND